MKIFDTVADLQAARLTAGQIVETKGRVTAGDGGADTYLVKTLVDFGATPDEKIHLTIANGNIAVSQSAYLRAKQIDGTEIIKIYVDPAGSDTGRTGFDSAAPLATIQKAVDTLASYYCFKDRKQIICAAGTYNEKIVLPDGLAADNNYLEFKFPSDPGLQGDPAAWPVGGAILSGLGFTGAGFSCGRYNKVYVEYLLFKDWFDIAVAATSQVSQAFNVGAYSFAFVNGCSATGNGWSNFAVLPMGHLVLTGGILDGARYALDNTGGRLSLTAGVSTYTTVKNALEYGLHTKHQASNVLDYTRFDNCGQVAGAEYYGTALFAYKTGASIDTRGCEFTNNNICYHSRGGSISRNPGIPDVIGTGNDRVWRIQSNGADDLTTYRSITGKDLVRLNGEASTASATTAEILLTGADIPATYLQSADQYLEIEIYGVNNSASAAELRPRLKSTEPNNYGIGVFSIPALSQFRVKLLVYGNGAAAQYVQWDNVNATSGGLLLGDTVATAKLGTFDHELVIAGSVPSATLVINKVRCVLWG